MPPWGAEREERMQVDALPFSPALALSKVEFRCRHSRWEPRG